MHPGVLKFLQYGFYGGILLISTDLLHIWYERYRNRIAKRPINEVSFVTSNNLQCCDYGAEISTIKACINRHCKAKLLNKILDHLNSANHLICIAMYTLTIRQIGDAIMDAKNRGVTVRIISDHSMIHLSGSQINRLQLEGVPVRIAGYGDGENYMHNKFCLIDVLVNENSFENIIHPVNGILINGSMSWTWNAFNRNWGNIHFTSDEHLKTEYKNAFDYIWNRTG